MNATPTPFFMLPDVPGADRPRASRLIRFSQVDRQTTRWLWPGRIAVGKVTVLVGETGIGKGSVAVDLAARVSRGSPWPDGNVAAPLRDAGATASDSHVDGTKALSNGGGASLGETRLHAQGTTIFVCPQSEQCDAMPARLEAAGADLDCICAIESNPQLPVPAGPVPDIGLRNGSDKAANSKTGFVAGPSIPQHLAALQMAIESMPDCKLVVIDPLALYLSGPDGRRFGAMQVLLQSLAGLARRRGVAIVVVMPMHGRASMRAIERTMEMIGPTAGFCDVWAVVRDPADRARRLMLPLQGNLGDERDGLSFQLTKQEGAAVPRIEWGAAVTTTFEEALAGSSGFHISEQLYRDAEQHTTLILRQELADGPVERKWLTHLVDRCEPRLYRAAERLGVVKRKIPYGWVWMLPEHVAKWEVEEKKRQEIRRQERMERKNSRERAARRERREAKDVAGMSLQTAAVSGPRNPSDVLPAERAAESAMRRERCGMGTAPTVGLPSAREALGDLRSGRGAGSGDPRTTWSNAKHTSGLPWRQTPPSFFEQPAEEFESSLAACPENFGKGAKSARGNSPHEALLRDAAG